MSSTLTLRRRVPKGRIKLNDGHGGGLVVLTDHGTRRKSYEWFMGFSSADPNGL